MDLPRPQVRLELELFLGDVRLADFEGVSQQSVSVDNLEAQLNLALADSSEIEQVVNESGFQFHISPDELQGFLHCFRKANFVLQSCHRGQNRGEWSAQLVTEHGQKFVFSGAGR